MNHMKFYGDVRLKRLIRHTDDQKPRSVGRALDVLRVGLWFEGLRARLGSTTAYGLGQIIQPHTYKKGLHHNNLWAKYACGRHVPGVETVQAGASKVPGSEELLDSPAWHALDVTRSAGCSGDSLLRSLRPSVQVAVFEARELSAGRYVRRSALGRSLRSLEGQADLQSLAATVVLLRNAHERGDASMAYTIGRSLHRSLLMAAACSPLKFVSLELFEFFIRTVFPMSASKKFALELDRDMLRAQLAWLTGTAMQLHKSGKPGFSLVGDTRQLMRLLHGNFGLDLMFGLGPRLKLNVPAEEADEDETSFVAVHNAHFEWGVSVLRAGRCERFPPTNYADVIAERALTP
ncbi:hypothetical protein [Luteimonas fraxinea]|uniref:Uncharacterized protein n=1 Tax=Luteimonas fraxinea TaxID=2901869 RepID=A0ABS8UAH7_9GAMM|nr:hypothetical protein [Luteimonas fraxinea]MCD9096503.1 hypothetical protein [Luteimonas fraxinea]